MVNWEDGELVRAGYVEIDGEQYEVVPPEYTGNTPASAENLLKMQNDLKELTESIDFTNQVIFNENPSLSHTYFIKKGDVVFVSYQGENKAHLGDEIIAIIPEDYRPSRTQIYAVCTIGSSVSTTMCVFEDGNVKLGGLSNSVNGRIYANFTYFLN